MLIWKGFEKGAYDTEKNEYTEMSLAGLKMKYSMFTDPVVWGLVHIRPATLHTWRTRHQVPEHFGVIYDKADCAFIRHIVNIVQCESADDGLARVRWMRNGVCVKDNASYITLYRALKDLPLKGCAVWMRFTDTAYLRIEFDTDLGILLPKVAMLC